MDNSDINQIRTKQKFLFYFKHKYSQLIELDLIKRSVSRIINFSKRYVLFPVINQEQVKNILGIHRFRCYVIQIPLEEQEKINKINENYNIQKIVIDTEEYGELKEVMLKSLEEDNNNQINNIMNKTNGHKIPMMIDLSNTIINNNIILDGKTQNKLSEHVNKINIYSLSGERFMQMINHSKALTKIYNSEDNKLF
jgi:hypothetical protein